MSEGTCLCACVREGERVCVRARESGGGRVAFDSAFDRAQLCLLLKVREKERREKERERSASTECGSGCCPGCVCVGEREREKEREIGFD